MMCCSPITQSFVNASTLTIPFGAIQQAEYGAQPNVQVYIKDGTEYVLSDDMNEVRFTGENIEIDFGGPATGFVKVF
jgi:hypothetical protein